jgi:hypothetical protein
MTRLKQSIAILAGIVLLLVILLFMDNAHVSGPAKKLSVVFVGMTNNPARQMTPTRIELSQGATGLCAMFWVSNAPANHFIWFKTDSVEQKTETGWQRFVPSGGDWSGVEGSRWQPGYGCFFAVGWPSGLATNATWRLQVRYGRDPSTLGIIVNEKTGREIFRSGKAESSIPSSEVIQ